MTDIASSSFEYVNKCFPAMKRSVKPEASELVTRQLPEHRASKTRMFKSLKMLQLKTTFA
jgi:hypothetical protein